MKISYIDVLMQCEDFGEVKKSKFPRMSMTFANCGLKSAFMCGVFINEGNERLVVQPTVRRL